MQVFLQNQAYILQVEKLLTHLKVHLVLGIELFLSTLSASTLQGHWGSDYYPTKCRGWLNNPRVTQIPGNLAYSLSIKYTENDPIPWHFFSWDSCYNNSELFNLCTELMYNFFKFSAWSHFSSKPISLEQPKVFREKLFDSLWRGSIKSMKNLKGGEGNWERGVDRKIYSK